MNESANTLATRKVNRAHRITVCAQKLTDEHGFDGFTMDELAEAADVSRRTLFNYFPGKLDAVIGPVPEVSPEVMGEFCAGGPHGNLLADLRVVIAEILGVKEFDRDEVEVARRIFKSEPRILAAAHERFSDLSDMFADSILQREGKEFGDARARVLIHVLACLYGVALEDVLSDSSDRRNLVDAYFDALDTVRELFR